MYKKLIAAYKAATKNGELYNLFAINHGSKISGRLVPTKHTDLEARDGAEVRSVFGSCLCSVTDSMTDFETTYRSHPKNSDCWRSVENWFFNKDEFFKDEDGSVIRAVQIVYVIDEDETHFSINLVKQYDSVNGQYPEGSFVASDYREAASVRIIGQNDDEIAALCDICTLVVIMCATGTEDVISAARALRHALDLKPIQNYQARYRYEEIQSRLTLFRNAALLDDLAKMVNCSMCLGDLECQGRKLTTPITLWWCIDVLKRISQTQDKLMLS